MNVVVHPADIQDRDGAFHLLRRARRLFPFIERIFADGGYAGRKMAMTVWRTGRWPRGPAVVLRAAAWAGPLDGGKRARLERASDVGALATPWPRSQKNLALRVAEIRPLWPSPDSNRDLCTVAHNEAFRIRRQFAKKVIAITAPSPPPEHPQQSRSQLGEFAMSDKTNRNLTGEEWRQISGGLFFSEEAVHAFEDQLQNVDQMSAAEPKSVSKRNLIGISGPSPISLALSGLSTGSDRAATALII